MSVTVTLGHPYNPHTGATLPLQRVWIDALFIDPTTGLNDFRGIEIDVDFSQSANALTTAIGTAVRTYCASVGYSVPTNQINVPSYTKA